MFDNFQQKLSDALNDLKIQLYENTHQIDNTGNDFDDNFYDWSKISYSCFSGYYWDYSSEPCPEK